MSDESSEMEPSKARNTYVLLPSPVVGCAKVKVAISLMITIVVVSLAITFALVISLCCLKDEWKIARDFEYSDEPLFYKKGAVASDHVYCSRLGRRILQKNGSAVDAAIAATICLGIVNMHSSGVGGGGSMIVYTKQPSQLGNYSIDYYDFRESASRKVNSSFHNFKSPQIKLGALSICTPGEIHGLYTAWKEHGNLPWSELVEPSLKLVKVGIPMHRRLYEASNYMLKYILNDEGLTHLLVKPNSNKTYDRNETFSNPALYHTLTVIRDDPMSFYTGNLSKEIAKEIQNKGGIVDEIDLQNYKTIKRKPTIYDIDNDYKMFSAGPPFSGDLLAFIINLLKHYNITSDVLKNNSITAECYHRIIESFKFGFGLRKYYSDPDFSKIPLDELLTTVLGKNFTDQIHSKINNITHPPSYYMGTVDLTVDHGTTHVSVVAPDGSAVSLTSSINIWFGSGFRSPKLGILFNNHMDDFSYNNYTNAYNLRPTPYNKVEPNKRSFSSMVPTIILKNGKFYMTIGASGGTRIITSVASVIVYKLWLNDSIDQAINRPRLHHQLVPNAIVVDKYSPSNETLSLLHNQYKHNTVYTSIPEYSAVQAVLQDEHGNIFAKSDPRKYGQAIGY